MVREINEDAFAKIGQHSRDVFDRLTLPSEQAETYTLSGLMIPDEPGPIARLVSEPAPIARLRFVEHTRPVTARKRRLCQRDGHPPSRLAPEYGGRLIGGATEWFSILPDESVPLAKWCQRCGERVSNASA